MVMEIKAKVNGHDVNLATVMEVVSLDVSQVVTNLTLLGRSFGVAAYHSYTVTTNLDNTITASNLGALDLLARFSTATNKPVFVYTKAGVALTKCDLANVGVDAEGKPIIIDKSDVSLRPEIGVGVMANVSKSIALGLAYSYIVGKGNLGDNKYISSVGFGALNFIYNF